MKDERKAKWQTKNIVFTAIYITAFLGAGIIGLLSNSFFAYRLFNMWWADIVYMLCIAAMFITAFVQELFDSRKLPDVVLNAFIFIGGCIIFFLLFLSEIATFISVIYSAVLLSVVLLRYALGVRKGETHPIDNKQVIAIAVLILFAMVAMMRVNFINELYIAWSLIPAAVISVVAGVIALYLFRGQWDMLFPTRAKKITALILGGIFTLMISFFYSFTAIGVANCAFDGEPTQSEYVVVDKHINSGARTVTDFEVKVQFDDGYEWISVPVTDYHNLSAGDSIIINHYSGALGFAYISYGGIKE